MILVMIEAPAAYRPSSLPPGSIVAGFFHVCGCLCKAPCIIMLSLEAAGG